MAQHFSRCIRGRHEQLLGHPARTYPRSRFVHRPISVPPHKLRHEQMEFVLQELQDSQEFGVRRAARWSRGAGAVASSACCAAGLGMSSIRMRNRSAPTRSAEPAVSRHGLQPTEPAPACSRGAELGAIQIYHVVAVNSRFLCHQLLGRGAATRYYDLSLIERCWTYSYSRVRYVSQQMRPRLGHRQATALVRLKREDGAWLTADPAHQQLNRRVKRMSAGLACAADL